MGEAAPVLERLGDHLWAVVHPQKRRGAMRGGQAI